MTPAEAQLVYSDYRQSSLAGPGYRDDTQTSPPGPYSEPLPALPSSSSHADHRQVHARAEPDEHHRQPTGAGHFDNLPHWCWSE